MGLNNAYQIYNELVEQYTPGRRLFGMEEAVQEMAHSFCQRDNVMRLRRVEHPMHTQDITNLFDIGIGRKVLSDSLVTVFRRVEQPKGLMKAQYALSNRQKKAPWRTHQSVAHNTKGQC